MFLLPSLGLGFLFAVLLGGRPSRVLERRFRIGWTVLLALGLQVVIFSRSGSTLDPDVRQAVHLLSYGLLLLFAATNLRARLLLPVLAGLALNAIAIAANGGRMPLSTAAAKAAGLDPTRNGNVSEAAGRLGFLGDVFALPFQLPLANVFSVGDLLIGFGMMAYIVAVATSDGDTPPLSFARILAPLRASAYRRMVAARLVSQMGDWLTIAALVGWIYEQSGSTREVAGLLLIRLAPPILGSGFVALLVDRLPKQRVLVWVEVARGVAVAGALLAVLGSDRTLVFVAIGVSGALAAVSSAVLPALLPSLLPDEQLPPANAGLGIAKDVAMAIGAGGAGVALSSVGVTPALVVDAATFVVAATLYLGLRRVSLSPSIGRDGRSPSGFRYLIRQPTLLLLIASFGAATLATGLTNATLPRFLGGSVGLGPGAYGFGIAAIAGGLALGEALVGFARVGATAGRWIGAGLMLMSGLFGLLALSTHAPTAFLLLGAIGFVDGTTDVLFQTIVQRRADPRHYGCVFGFSSALMTTTMMGAFVAAPMANELFGSRSVILVAGATLLLAGVIALVAMGPTERRRAVVRPDRGDGVGLDLEQLVGRLEGLVDTTRRLQIALAERTNDQPHRPPGDVRVQTNTDGRDELERRVDVVVPRAEVEVDRLVARAGNGFDVLDDPLPRRLVVVAGDHKEALNGDAELLERFVVGERRPLTGRPVVNEPIRTALDEVFIEFAEALQVDKNG